MNNSTRSQNKSSNDPLDILIFQKGLRIRNVLVDKDIDLLLIVLNNGMVLKEVLSSYPTLRKASAKNLNSWKLISGGIGITWSKLNEDLSLKGFIHSSSMNETLRLLQNKPAKSRIIL